MFSKELTEVIIGVLTSWQVIAITLGIIIYIAIVSSVARLYHTARPKEPKGKKMKAEPKAAESPVEAGEADELGLAD